MKREFSFGNLIDSVQEEQAQNSPAELQSHNKMKQSMLGKDAIIIDEKTGELVLADEETISKSKVQSNGKIQKNPQFDRVYSIKDTNDTQIPQDPQPLRPYQPQPHHMAPSQLAPAYSQPHPHIHPDHLPYKPHQQAYPPQPYAQPPPLPSLHSSSSILTTNPNPNLPPHYSNHAPNGNQPLPPYKGLSPPQQYPHPQSAHDPQYPHEYSQRPLYPPQPQYVQNGGYHMARSESSRSSAKGRINGHMTEQQLQKKLQQLPYKEQSQLQHQSQQDPRQSSNIKEFQEKIGLNARKTDRMNKNGSRDFLNQQSQSQKLREQNSAQGQGKNAINRVYTLGKSGSQDIIDTQSFSAKSERLKSLQQSEGTLKSSESQSVIQEQTNIRESSNSNNIYNSINSSINSNNRGGNTLNNSSSRKNSGNDGEDDQLLKERKLESQAETNSVDNKDLDKADSNDITNNRISKSINLSDEVNLDNSLNQRSRSITNRELQPISSINGVPSPFQSIAPSQEDNPAKNDFMKGSGLDSTDGDLLKKMSEMSLREQALQLQSQHYSKHSLRENYYNDLKQKQNKLNSNQSSTIISESDSEYYSRNEYGRQGYGSYGSLNGANGNNYDLYGVAAGQSAQNYYGQGPQYQEGGPYEPSTPSLRLRVPPYASGRSGALVESPRHHQQYSPRHGMGSSHAHQRHMSSPYENYQFPEYSGLNTARSSQYNQAFNDISSDYNRFQGGRPSRLHTSRPNIPQFYRGGAIESEQSLSRKEYLHTYKLQDKERHYQSQTEKHMDQQMKFIQQQHSRIKDLQEKFKGASNDVSQMMSLISGIASLMQQRDDQSELIQQEYQEIADLASKWEKSNAPKLKKMTTKSEIGRLLPQVRKNVQNFRSLRDGDLQQQISLKIDKAKQISKVYNIQDSKNGSSRQQHNDQK